MPTKIGCRTNKMTTWAGLTGRNARKQKKNGLPTNCGQLFPFFDDAYPYLPFSRRDTPLLEHSPMRSQLIGVMGLKNFLDIKKYKCLCSAVKCLFNTSKCLCSVVKCLFSTSNVCVICQMYMQHFRVLMQHCRIRFQHFQMPI